LNIALLTDPSVISVVTIPSAFFSILLIQIIGRLPMDKLKNQALGADKN
jgi:hypothetical protein